MNAEDMRKLAMQELLPPIEEECKQVMYTIEELAKKGWLKYHGILTVEQFFNTKYRKAFKKYFEEKGFSVRFSIIAQFYTISW